MAKLICSLIGDSVLHVASGLRVMPRSYHEIYFVLCHRVELPPACCPVSKNPSAGSTLSLRYTPENSTLEVYSLRSLLNRFVGGYPGSECGTYPPERNMEGMVQLVAQMAADALQVSVRFRSVILLDTGEFRITGFAEPRSE